MSWDALAQTVGYLLNWGMSGVPYLTCDIGGFNGDDTPAQLLVRWYQVGAFLGVFRVHSKNTNTPHFPFLYDAASAAAMKKAMVLRYTLVPMLYSLAHSMYESGSTIQRPLFFEFPTDAATFTMTTQWMVGTSLLVAPVLTADNNVQAYLPAATWFELGSATAHDGPTTLSLTNVAMDACPVFVRAGSIVPLAPSSLQFTDQLPGGPLNVQVYAGADAEFVLIEDDGESRDYEGGAAIAQAVRHTALRWNEAKRLLSWSVQGSFADAHTFVQVSATLFVRGGPAGGNTSAVVALGMEGSIQF